jgi:hypothetical protein
MCITAVLNNAIIRSNKLICSPKTNAREIMLLTVQNASLFWRTCGGLGGTPGSQHPRCLEHCWKTSAWQPVYLNFWNSLNLGEPKLPRRVPPESDIR